MSEEKRMVSGQQRKSERENFALRPQRLADMVGQDRVRENLSIIIDAAAARDEPIDHILFYGPPGLGKTSLAYVIANEVQGNIRVTAGPSLNARATWPPFLRISKRATSSLSTRCIAWAKPWRRYSIRRWKISCWI